MNFTEVNRSGRSFFAHPAAENSRGGSLMVDVATMAIRHTPFKVRGDEAVWEEFTPVLASPIARIIGAPFAPIFVLDDGTEITAKTETPEGFFDEAPGLSLVYKLPVASLVPRPDGMIEAKRLTVTGNFKLALQTVTAQQMLDGDASADINGSLACYASQRNNARYLDGTFTDAMAGKACHLRAPEFVCLTQGGVEISRFFGSWEIQGGDIVKVADPAHIPVGTIFIETAATLGYTTIGAIKVGSNFEGNHGWIGNLPIDAVVNALYVYINATGTVNGLCLPCMYVGDGSHVPDPLFASNIQNKAAAVFPAWNNFAMETAAITSQELWGGIFSWNDSGADIECFYDNGVYADDGYKRVRFVSGGTLTTAPDPYVPFSTAGNNDAGMSVYVSFVEAAAGGAIGPWGTLR